MELYVLFFKTVMSTVVSLLGAAAVLFTSVTLPDAPPPGLRLRLAAYTPEQAPENRAGAVVDALVAALTDADADVRHQAARALGEIGDARAVSGLVAALADAQPDVRKQAAWALGQLAYATAQGCEGLLSQRE